MSEDTETLDLTTDEALLSSLAEHKMEELKLYPLSLMRHTIALDLIDQGSGSFYCAVMTVWVCSLKEDEALEAHTDLKAAKKKAFAWAESRGYSIFDKHWKPLVDTYLKLMREWQAVAEVRIHKSEVLGSNGEGAEIPNAGGQAV
jgi:gamma-glutamylcysteine synthetase